MRWQRQLEENAIAKEIVDAASRKAFFAFLDPLCQKEWMVYAKAPFRGPDHLLHYLARYTHRVAISTHRLLAFDGESFRWKDYAHGNKKRKMTLSADEFLRRFLLHTLPRAFVRIRFCGFLAGRRRLQMLQLARCLLQAQPTTVAPDSTPAATSLQCPVCATRMIVVERLSAAQAYRIAALSRQAINDSSQTSP
jgi:hypothetical protein